MEGGRRPVSHRGNSDRFARGVLIGALFGITACSLLLAIVTLLLE